ncbi:hypothetical protein VAE122_50016 [Vibrio aestuarianus]|nr:hypothetical protein VAE122_50016 [Vibrio aestuarianus]
MLKVLNRISNGVQSDISNNEKNPVGYNGDKSRISKHRMGAQSDTQNGENSPVG